MPTSPLRRPKALSLFAGTALALAGVGALVGALATSEATAANTQEIVRDGTFTVDPVHSTVFFRVLFKNSSYFFGRFNTVEGSFIVEPQDPDNAYIDLTIKTASVDTNNDDRDKHLRSADFFSARQYPNATFVSTHAEKIDDDTILFTGDLTIRGVSQEIQVEAEKIGDTTDRGKNRAGWLCTFKFNRSDFNVSYGIPGLSDETELTVSINGTQE